MIAKHFIQSCSLVNGSWKPVENKSLCIKMICDLIFDHFDDYFVRHQSTVIQVFFGNFA